jgi:hypothetical protein
MDLGTIFREAKFTLVLTWTWIKDAVVDNPVLVILVGVVIYIIWRLLKPSFK